jgi:hypothetical protein
VKRLIDDDEVESLRRKVGAPADWLWGWCENDCGEVAFYPPDVEKTAAETGTPLVLVCSASCASQQIEKYGGLYAEDLP